LQPSIKLAADRYFVRWVFKALGFLTCAEAPLYLNKVVLVRFRTFQHFITARRFHLQPVAMELKKDIERANRRIESVCFMVTGIASVVAVQSNETRVEVGLAWLGGDERHRPSICRTSKLQRVPAKLMHNQCNRRRAAPSPR